MVDEAEINSYQCRMAMLSGLFIKIIHFFFSLYLPSRWFI